VTAKANPTATAASTAFPPFLRISMPTLEANGSADTTIPFFPRAGVREAPWRGTPVKIARKIETAVALGRTLSRKGMFMKNYREVWIGFQQADRVLA